MSTSNRHLQSPLARFLRAGLKTKAHHMDQLGK